MLLPVVKQPLTTHSTCFQTKHMSHKEKFATRYIHTWQSACNLLNTCPVHQSIMPRNDSVSRLVQSRHLSMLTNQRLYVQYGNNANIRCDSVSCWYNVGCNTTKQQYFLLNNINRVPRL